MGRRVRARHKNNAAEHFKGRCEERYGISLNRHDRKLLVEQIRKGRAECVGSYSNTRKLFFVVHEGIRLPVIYNNQLHTIVTVLPPDAKELIEDEEPCPDEATAPPSTDGHAPPAP